MLKPTRNACPSMTDEERKQFEFAVAEEAAAKVDNTAAAKKIAPKVVEACEVAVAIVQLREAREAA